MKRCIKCGLFMAALAVLFSLGAAALPPQTGNATTYTYTLNAENGWTRTQDAYLTGEVLFLNAPLTRPEDLTVRGRMLYVADTGAGRILRYDLDTGETASLGEGILQTPTGVFVTGEGNIYVADPDRAVVTMLSPEGGAASGIWAARNHHLRRRFHLQAAKGGGGRKRHSVHCIGRSL